MKKKIGAMTLVLAVFAAVAGVANLNGPPVARAQSVGQAIIERLRTAADAGDRQAQAALADLQQFLARNHLDQSVLDTPSPFRQDDTRGHIQIVARGLAPFWIDLVPSADLSTKASLSSYVAERRAAAASLSAMGSSVEGRLGFSGLVTLGRLLSLRDQLGLVVRDADVDVWLDENWVSRAGFGPEQTEFWAQPASVVDPALRSLVADAHAGEPVASRIAEARLTVHGATVEASADAAAHLLAAPDVLVFDPYTDLLSPYQGLAAHVRVVAPVDVFDAWLRSRARVRDPYPFTPSPKGSK